MRNRIGVAAALLLACTFALQGQQSMYKIKLNPSGSMIALDKPVLLNGKYVFHAWPHGEQTALRQKVVLSVAPLTGRSTRSTSLPRARSTPRTTRRSREARTSFTRSATARS